MDETYQQAIRYWTLAQPVVSAYVAAVVRDFRDRDDVLQAISVAVLESFPTYESTRPFIAWAMGIARNQVGSYLRERKRNRLVFDAETVDLLAVAFEQIHDPGDGGQPQRFREAVSGLTPIDESDLTPCLHQRRSQIDSLFADADTIG